jgi:hypothetical protein
MTTEQLTRALSDTLDAVPPPPPDLDAVRTRARGIGRRRRITVAAVAVGAVAAAWIGAYQLADGAADVIRPDSDIAVPGGLDTTDGLRAVAAEGAELLIGGARIPLKNNSLPYLDTDAAATQYGVLWPDPGGTVHLLDAAGNDQILSGSSDSPENWHPTIKVDPAEDLAAWMTYADGEPTLEVYDLAGDEVVARAAARCMGDCEDLVIDAVSGGRVVLRGEDGTLTWNWSSEDQAWVPFAGPATRVADVKNGVVLYDGPRPTRMPDGWRAVPGPVDGMLTHDGGHVVAWDRVLPATVPGAPPIRLEDVGAIFYTVDTDGSVMAATLGPTKVYDCEVPSGACEQFGTLSEGSGDPVFIGADM